MALAQIGYWPLDEPFPALLTDAQLMRTFGISTSQFYKLKKLGRFRIFEARPQLLTRTRYSGELVTHYVRGGWTATQTFGRGTQRRLSVVHDAHRVASVR